MKKTLLILLALVVGSLSSTNGFAASAILTGQCIATTPNNVTTDAWLADLGNHLTNPVCWSGLNPNDNGVPLPSGGILKNLAVSARYSDGGSTPASWPTSVTVYVNGSVTALTCSLSLSGGTSTPTTINCSDTTHTVSVNAGDVIAVKMSTSGVTCSGTSCPSLSIDAALEKGTCD